MRDQEIIGLWESYHQVHSQVDSQEEVEQLDEAMSSYDRNRQRAAQRAAARNEARKAGKTGNVPGVGYVSPRPERETWTDESGKQRHKTGARMPKNESFDLFDIILEHLVAEGYADTNEAALAIMTNMSEEWKQTILEREMDEPGESDTRPDVKAYNRALKYKPRPRRPRIEDDPRYGTPMDKGGKFKY